MLIPPKFNDNIGHVCSTTPVVAVVDTSPDDLMHPAGDKLLTTKETRGTTLQLESADSGTHRPQFEIFEPVGQVEATRLSRLFRAIGESSQRWRTGWPQNYFPAGG